jgi:hypothetical protein
MFNVLALYEIYHGYNKSQVLKESTEKLFLPGDRRVLKKLVYRHMPFLIAALHLEIMVECDQYLFFPFLQEIHVRDFGGKLVITAFVLNALTG